MPNSHPPCAHRKHLPALQEEDEDAYTELPEDNTEQEGEEPLPYPATPFSVSVAKGDSELRCVARFWSWNTPAPVAREAGDAVRPDGAVGSRGGGDCGGLPDRPVMPLACQRPPS